MSDLIKLVGGIAKARAIVEGAPSVSKYYCASAGMNHSCDDLINYECCITMGDLRTAIADHNRTDNCVDITNHISPSTKIIEKQLAFSK